MKTMVEITEQEYNKLYYADKKQIRESASDAAIEKGYHPAGYGLFNPRIEKTENKFYIAWDRLSSCDW